MSDTDATQDLGMGHVVSDNRPWGKDEIEALKSYYPTHGAAWEGWGRLLHNRSRRAITSKAHSIGLKYREPQDPSEEIVMSMRERGYLLEEIDTANNWYRGKAKKVLMYIWATS